MAHAYTPGLKVVEKSMFKKDRKLPLQGDVLVKKGEIVKAETVVAATYLPGNVQAVNIANLLGLEPHEIKDYMKMKAGDKLEKGDIIAETPGLWGFFKTTVPSPIEGLIENVSDVTGQVMLREPPIPVEVSAYVDGRVEEIYPGEGVEMATIAAYIQGIFGIGGEVTAPLAMASTSPTDVLDESRIKPEFAGKIIVGGSFVTAAGIKKAIDTGVKGIVVGGFDAQDLMEFLGHDLGVAITGAEQKGLTLVVTEGFGKINMARKTFDLLSRHAGKKTSINGATQIRAGVIRPEVVIPLEGEKLEADKKTHEMLGMDVGSPVRIIREPHFGQIAKVVRLPVEPAKIATEAKVRTVEIELLDSKERCVLPRANVELIEE